MPRQRKKAEEKEQAKEPVKRGRPSLYSDELADTICERMALGETTRKICEDEDMPTRQTLYRWLSNPEFMTKCARARELQADHLDEEMMVESMAATPETVNVARLRVETMKWRAARMAPKKYGDRIEQVHSGAIDINSAPDEQVDERLAALRAKEIPLN